MEKTQMSLHYRVCRERVLNRRVAQRQLSSSIRGLVLGRIAALLSAGSPMLSPNNVSGSTAYPSAERFFTNGDWGDLETYSSELSWLNGKDASGENVVLVISLAANVGVIAGERVARLPVLGEDRETLRLTLLRLLVVLVDWSVSSSISEVDGPVTLSSANAIFCSNVGLGTGFGDSVACSIITAEGSTLLPLVLSPIFPLPFPPVSAFLRAVIEGRLGSDARGCNLVCAAKLVALGLRSSSGSPTPDSCTCAGDDE